MIKEVIGTTWDQIRCTWDTRGGNILLAWQVRRDETLLFDLLVKEIGDDQIRLLPEARLTCQEPVKRGVHQEIRSFAYEFSSA